MSDGKKTESVGVKVTEEKRDQLRELAYQRRTTISELLRNEIDELLEEADEVPVADVDEQVAD
ncbi:hypothetical protein [Haloarcula argentinensis]|uniref:Ribbon-helix-helix protein, CopG family n=1 Tax=Haloarcula argentinensis TaxID=43776 RepID=A0ABU2F7N1_HALAR|nr:hypothetical protein [Haloarcula argentinensis]MDS0256060.1 hypothetical protein [Haloarcula argentinensis]